MSTQRVVYLSDRPLRLALAVNLLSIAALAVVAQFVAPHIPMELKLQAALYAGSLLVWVPVAIYGFLEIGSRLVRDEKLVIISAPETPGTTTDDASPAQYSDANLRLVLGFNALAVGATMLSFRRVFPMLEPADYALTALFAGSLLVWVPVMLYGMYEVGTRLLTGKVEPIIEALPLAEENNEVQLDELPELKLPQAQANQQVEKELVQLSA